MLFPCARKISAGSLAKLLSLFLVAAATVPFFSACTQGDSVTVSTIQFSPDSQGWIQFKTNDKENYGYGFFERYTNTNMVASLVTATVKKNSGSPTAGYGVVFSFNDTNNFYRVLVSEDGYFAVSQKVAGTYTTLQSWTQSPNVNTGFGVQNTIKAEYWNNLYNVYINDLATPVFSFTPSPYLGTSGCAGFYAGVGTSASENFPGTPADIRFKMTAPFGIP